MAVLVKQSDGTRATLLSRHMVGRSRLADLRMSEPTVSGEHAVISWTGREWRLHDLGSRNGTSLDGRRLTAGERVLLARGSLITFGQDDNAWVMTDDDEPALLALPADGGEPLVARNELLALPSDDDPVAEVYRNALGEWVLEHAGETTRIADHHVVRVGERELVLRVPDVIATTWDSSVPSPHLSGLTLRFSVSLDEEYVALTARSAHRDLDLGARAHHAVLLALARSRLEDQKTTPPASSSPGRLGTSPESAHGWVYLDDLARELGLDEQHLNVAIFRSRRQLSEAGIMGAASIVERRRPTRELRLGVSRIEIITV
ncbi:MAG: FHA domain-containing protein [Myxococcales bacterium]|nr:FHA domain-containing protein [Myxococcales bacterium]